VPTLIKSKNTTGFIDIPTS